MKAGAPEIAAVGIADYHRHLLRLDRASRWSRFAAAVDDRAIDAHCLRLLAARADLTGIVVDGELRGGAEIIPHTTDSLADAAFSIETPWRGRGWGRALMARVAARARELGMSELILDTSDRNEPMLRLIARYGGVALDGGRISGFRIALHGDPAPDQRPAGGMPDALLQGYV